MYIGCHGDHEMRSVFPVAFDKYVSVRCFQLNKLTTETIAAASAADAKSNTDKYHRDIIIIFSHTVISSLVLKALHKVLSFDADYKKTPNLSKIGLS